MNFICIDKNYHVSPQIEPHQISDIAEKGFVRIICNRPDLEVPPSLSSSVMAAFAAKEQIEFHILELTHQTMTPENISKQREMFINANGPVLAYCASGTRCSVIWALGEAMIGTNINYILEKTLAAGYNLSGLEASMRNFAN